MTVDRSGPMEMSITPVSYDESSSSVDHEERLSQPDEHQEWWRPPPASRWVVWIEPSRPMSIARDELAPMLNSPELPLP